ncbi:EF-hand domain-containing protein [Brevundimonas lenta]|uniref:Ca2+-binding EF-hand superfamily protein n=1 Tax=Brevundimonas lenta TaxID=424796 RepID=A0A7W6JEL4_9CAUL|nr:hypothetical protein [Brevundimonas lenta]MBB4082707.1 Ca2+-binding EF-hand superfamily protein [Brevundimonas lenta]
MTLRQTLSAASAAVLLSALSGAALAQTPPPGAAPQQQRGGMGLPRTSDEVQPWADRLFGRLDANQDGAITGDELAFLSQGEVASRGGSRIRAMVSQSDSSRDARVSQEELSAGAARTFARMDVNGDGRLSDDELPQAPRPAQVQMPPMPSADPMPMPTPDAPGGR